MPRPRKVEADLRTILLTRRVNEATTPQDKRINPKEMGNYNSSLSTEEKLTKILQELITVKEEVAIIKKSLQSVGDRVINLEKAVYGSPMSISPELVQTSGDSGSTSKL